MAIFRLRTQISNALGYFARPRIVKHRTDFRAFMYKIISFNKLMSYYDFLLVSPLSYNRYILTYQMQLPVIQKSQILSHSSISISNVFLSQSFSIAQTKAVGHLVSWNAAIRHPFVINIMDIEPIDMEHLHDPRLLLMIFDSNGEDISFLEIKAQQAGFELSDRDGKYEQCSWLLYNRLGRCIGKTMTTKTDCKMKVTLADNGRLCDQ
jgi:hypothetical protein